MPAIDPNGGVARVSADLARARARDPPAVGPVEEARIALAGVHDALGPRAARGDHGRAIGRRAALELADGGDRRLDLRVALELSVHRAGRPLESGAVRAAGDDDPAAGALPRRQLRVRVRRHHGGGALGSARRRGAQDAALLVGQLRVASLVDDDGQRIGEERHVGGQPRMGWTGRDHLLAVELVARDARPDLREAEVHRRGPERGDDGVVEPRDRHADALAAEVRRRLQRPLVAHGMLQPGHHQRQPDHVLGPQPREHPVRQRAREDRSEQ